MIRVLSIVVCIIVLLSYSFVFAAEGTKAIGRFQVVASTEKMFILVDTVTGQSWALSTKHTKSGKAIFKWVPVTFDKTISPGTDEILIEE